MTLFQHQYATIEEAWGQPMFSPSIVNRYKSQEPTRQESEDPSDQEIKRALNATYQTKGIDGIKAILDTAIVRDIQAEALKQYQQKRSTQHRTSFDLTREEWMYVILGLFAIMFAVDSL